MTPFARALVVAGAVVFAVGACGGTIASSPVSSGQPAATSGHSPSEAPSSPPPVVMLGTADAGRALKAGRYRIRAPFEVPFSITLPAGWELQQLARGDVAFWKNGSFLQVDLVENVFVDPCDSKDGPMDPPVATTVDAVAAALTEMVNFNAGPVKEIVIGDARGKAFDLVNTINTDRKVCYGVQMLPLWTFRGGGSAQTNGGAHERIWVLDVSGTTVVVDRGGDSIDAVATSLSFETPSTPAPPEPSPMPTERGRHLSYVALGDSLLFAAEGDCDGCTSASVIYGARVAADLGLPVDVFNLTMHNSLTTPRLIEYLERGARTGRPEADMFEALAGADIVSVTIGFNDLAAPLLSDFDTRMTSYDADLERIVDRIEAFRAGKPTLILLTQIYNNGGPSWTATIEAENAVICRVAKRHGARCVDIYHPFNGLDGKASPQALGYLGVDETHPSQLGQQVIADAMADVGYAPLR